MATEISDENEERSPLRTGHKKRFVLVTGMPRSGTTPIGTILSAAPRASYVYEPFNADSGMRGIDVYFQGPIASTAESDLLTQIRSVLRLQMKLKPGAYETDRGVRALAKNVIGGHTKLSYLRCKLDPRVSTVIWKDPFASLLVPYLTRVERVPAVITVRSPYAVAASFKRLGWGFDLRHLHDQIRLDAPTIPLPPESVVVDPKADSVANAAGLWTLLYGYLARATADDPLVSWVDVAAVIRDPMPAYRKVFARAGLEFTARVEAKIHDTYKDEGTDEPAVGRAHDRHRNVQSSSEYWRGLLSDEDIRKVDAITLGTTDLVNERIRSA
ncbi:sulfotransferase [Microbacterium schleiferi]|uniref:sulfotransferase n=1 Tax=Microbacterium schleiferi TaxID=69362 RepID=UPI001D175E09|nr:sulfotransferase [Microbacterium schleiferi]MCC4266751.1 sulfotransferase [Microbacterium schleiferi]